MGFHKTDLGASTGDWQMDLKDQKTCGSHLRECRDKDESTSERGDHSSRFSYMCTRRLQLTNDLTMIWNWPIAIDTDPKEPKMAGVKCFFFICSVKLTKLYEFIIYTVFWNIHILWDGLMEVLFALLQTVLILNLKSLTHFKKHNTLPILRLPYRSLENYSS
jgi:hypothetical protein